MAPDPGPSSDPPDAPLRRSRRRAIFYIVLGLLVAALGLVFLGWFPQEPLRRVLETRLQEGLGPESSVRRLHVVPGRLRTEVVDLVIEGPAYRLEVPKARIVFSPGFFWGRSLSFREIEMESPRLTMKARTPAALSRRRRSRAACRWSRRRRSRA